MAAHRYWRLRCLTNGGITYALSVASLELREAPGGTNFGVNTTYGTAIASGNEGGYPASNCFDGSTATQWVGPAYTHVAGQWVGFDFGGSPRDIKNITVVNNPGGVAGEFLLTGVFEYSDDAGAWASYIPVTNGATPGGSTTADWVYVPPAVANLSPPSPALSASGGASATCVCPSPRLRALGGSGAATGAPSPTLRATAHDSAGEQAAYLTAPSPTLSAYAGASSKLTAPTQALASSGTVTGWASATLSAPSPTLAATGTPSGVATAALKGPSPNLIGYSGAVCSITLTGSPTLQASATTGGIGGAALSCPLFELTSSATAQNHGSANLLAPSPRMGQTAQAWLAAPSARLTAIGSAVITATYEAYAINLKHTPRPGAEPVDEMTHYTNFPFTHVIRHQNSYYGANSIGLYLLEGTTDDATPILWAVKTAMTDFKSPTLKTIASAYFSGRFGPASSITLSAGEKAPVAYSFTTPRGALAQNHRQAFGRGLKARYYALAASGTGTCEIDAVELDVHNLTRRI